MESREFGSEAESLFAELLSHGEQDIDAGVQALCRKRPELALALGEICAGYRLAEGVRRGLGLAPSVLSSHALDEGSSKASGKAASICPTPIPEPEERLASLAARARAGRRLELGRELGRGGMGQVLEAFDADLGRRLALKRIRIDRLPPKEGGDAAVRAHLLHRFLAEAQITAQLEHPGIVPVHDIGVDERGEPFYTMAKVEGEDLGRVFDKAREGREGWSLVRAVEILVRVAETLAYAHERGVVHRDIKPDNVRVGRLGQVYVTDWGLARVLGEEGATPMPVRTDRQRAIEEGSPLATREGLVPGTPQYMAPEQAVGHTAEISLRTDVYGLGALLYDLLAGRPPHPRGDSTDEELRRRVAKEPPTPLERLASEAPPELIAVAEKAMSRKPADRYASAIELASDLRAFLEGRVVQAHRTGAWIELIKWTRRNRLSAAAIGAAFVLLIGGLATAMGLRAHATESARLAEDRKDEAELQAEIAQKEAQRAELAERKVRLNLAEAHLRSADLARQRGSWKQVLEELEAARSAGFPDEIDLELRRAEALHALARHDEAVGMLDALLAREDLGAHRGRALLERGSLAMEEYAKPQEAEALIRDALEHDLAPSHAAYARGLLAPTVPESVQELRAALALAPFHHGARTALLVLLVVGGRHAEALEEARVLRAFYPEDALPDLADAVVFTLLAREDEADAALGRARAKLRSQEFENLEWLVSFVREFRDAQSPSAMIGGEDPDGRKAEQRIVALWWERSADLPEVLASFGVPNLPCIAASWGAGFQGLLAMIDVGNLLANFGKRPVNAPPANNFARARPHLARAWAANPDGAFAFFEAACVLAVGPSGADESQQREAEELYRRASEANSFLPGIQRAARLLATLCQCTVYRLAGDLAIRERAMSGIRYFSSLPDLRTDERMWLSTFSRISEEPEYALLVDRAWRGNQELASADLRRRAALWEVLTDKKRAMADWERVLELDPEDAVARTRLDELRRVGSSRASDAAPGGDGVSGD